MLVSTLLSFALSLLFLGRPTAGLSVPRSVHRLGPRRYQENDKLGAVASESSVCSQIGSGLIKAGGNAADAVCFLLRNQFPEIMHPSLTWAATKLVGTIFCVGVIGMSLLHAIGVSQLIIIVGMYHSGIGGGGFMLGKPKRRLDVSPHCEVESLMGESPIIQWLIRVYRFP